MAALDGWGAYQIWQDPEGESVAIFGDFITFGCPPRLPKFLQTSEILTLQHI